MKKVFKVIGIVFGSILFLCFLGYVVVFMFCYKYFNVTQDEYDKVVSGINIKDAITIKSKSVSDCARVDDVKFRNDFSKFKRYHYDDSDDSVSAWYMYKDQKSRNVVDFDVDIMDIEFSEDLKMFKNYKLKNINFNVLNIMDNNDFYDSVYTAYRYMSVDYFEIKGDYSGYIKTDNDSGIIYAYLYHNDKEYVFTFDGKGYFSMDYVTSFISSVVFI